MYITYTYRQLSLISFITFTIYLHVKSGETDDVIVAIASGRPASTVPDMSSFMLAVGVLPCWAISKPSLAFL